MASFISSEEWRIRAALVMVELLFAGFQVITKSAVSNLSINALCVLAFYRNILATAFLSPLAYFLDKNKRPKLSFRKLFHFFMSALVGISMNQTFFLLGIYYTTATFTSMMQNLIPPFTFILATSLRAEKVGLKSSEGQAKIIGTSISLCGAMIMSSYTGSPIISLPSSKREPRLPKEISFSLAMSTNKSMKLGLLCVMGNCATWALWFLLQGPIMRTYPAQLTASAFTFAFGSIQLLAISALPLITRVHVSWKIESYSYLIDVFYGGIITSGVATTMMSWCAHKGGAVLVGAYQPLQTIITICLSIIFLGDTLYIGSIIGGSLVLAGLYLVLWGKSKEKDTGEDIPEPFKCDIERATLNEPLIPNTK